MEEVESRELINRKLMSKYWIPARELDIYLIEDKRCWRWIYVDRTEVAELLKVNFLDIKGFLDVEKLRIKTKYSAHLVFKLAHNADGLDRLKTSVRYVKDKKDDGAGVNVNLNNKTDVNTLENGWMEIKLGDFINLGCGEVEMKLYDHDQDYWKSGLLVKGIEVRSTCF